MSDIGNRCVHCGEDTSFGSGKFVNRIPADADYEALDNQGNVIFADGEYRDGYACAECMALPCDRCDELIPLDEDICLDDGNIIVHYKCLTEDERREYDGDL
tara:strand:+ start:777 stop:1082 length:306 start_codon:yes stop_codon:yes gene_type:complete